MCFLGDQCHFACLPLLADVAGPVTICPFLETSKTTIKNPSYGSGVQLISKTKIAHSQNPLKQFSFSSCKRRGFLKSSLVFVEQNISGLSLFLYASLFFFLPPSPLQCSAVNYLLLGKSEHCRALFSNVSTILLFQRMFKCNWYLGLL